jgi:hypothetical protein
VLQPKSRWLLATAARVRSQIMSSGIYGARSGTGADFLLVVRFPSSVLIPPPAPHSFIHSLPPSHRRYIVSIQTAWLNNQLKHYPEDESEHETTFVLGTKIHGFFCGAGLKPH